MTWEYPDGTRISIPIKPFTPKKQAKIMAEYNAKREKIRNEKEARRNLPINRYRRTKKACIKLYKALSGTDREYKKFIYELDDHERAGLWNRLVATEAAAIDMLEILEAVKK